VSSNTDISLKLACSKYKWECLT